MSKNLFKERPEKVEKKFIWSSKEKAENVSPTNQVELNAMVETLDKINSKIAEGVTQSDIARTQLNTTGAVAPADIDRIRSTLVTLMDAVTTKRNKLSTGHENVSAISNAGTVTEIIRENEQTPAEYAAAQPEKLQGGIPNPQPINRPIGIELTQFEVDYIAKMLGTVLIDDGVIIRRLSNPEKIEVLTYLRPYLLPHATQWATLSHDNRMDLIRKHINKSYVNWRVAKGFLRAPAGMGAGSPSPSAAGGPGPAPPPGPAGPAPPGPAPPGPAPPGPAPPGPAPAFPVPNPGATNPTMTPKKPNKAGRRYTTLNPPGAIIPQNIWIPYYGEFDRGVIAAYLANHLRYARGIAPVVADIRNLMNNPNYLSQIITLQDDGPSSATTVASYKAGLTLMKVIYGLFSMNDQQIRDYDATTTNPHSRFLSAAPKKNGIFLRLNPTGPSVWV